MHIWRQLHHIPWPISATLGVCVGLGLGALTTMVHAGYLTSDPGSPVTNSYGECWNATGGKAGPVAACGDAIPRPTPTDRDGDGVADSVDSCAGTPSGVTVDARGCPPDSDTDGITDYRDKCPDSKLGVKVDRNGCAIIENLVIQVTTDHFAIDSAKLLPGMVSALNDLIKRVLATQVEERLSVVGQIGREGGTTRATGLRPRPQLP